MNAKPALVWGFSRLYILLVRLINLQTTSTSTSFPLHSLHFLTSYIICNMALPTVSSFAAFTWAALRTILYPFC